MKKLIMFVVLVVALLSCTDQSKYLGCLVGPKTYTPDHKENFAIETLSGEVGQGLHKITIDDTVHILIYRGVESVTMIQIK